MTPSFNLDDLPSVSDIQESVLAKPLDALQASFDAKWETIDEAYLAHFEPFRATFKANIGALPGARRAMRNFTKRLDEFTANKEAYAQYKQEIDAWAAVVDDIDAELARKLKIHAAWKYVRERAPQWPSNGYPKGPEAEFQALRASMQKVVAHMKNTATKRKRD